MQFFRALGVLVGYPSMNSLLFEPFREWVELLVGGRARKSPLQMHSARGARIVRAGGSRLERASGEINWCPEQEFPSSTRSSDPSKRPGLNIKQLTEPMLAHASSPLQDRYQP